MVKPTAELELADDAKRPPASPNRSSATLECPPVSPERQTAVPECDSAVAGADDDDEPPKTVETHVSDLCFTCGTGSRETKSVFEPTGAEAGDWHTPSAEDVNEFFATNVEINDICTKICKACSDDVHQNISFRRETLKRYENLMIKNCKTCSEDVHKHIGFRREALERYENLLKKMQSNSD